MNKMLRIIALCTLLFCTLASKALKSYRVYWDDPYVVEWIIDDDFKVEIAQYDPDDWQYSLKLIGKNSVIMFPIANAPMTFNDSHVFYFIEIQDLSRYVPDETFTLSERNGDIIIGNLKDNCTVCLFKEGGGPDEFEEYTPHKEFVINPNGEFDCVKINSNMFKFSAKK